jgi:hypothetical protein
MGPGHWIVITLIVAWVVVMRGVMWQTNQRALQRHRERLALIERGLPLPPEPASDSLWRAVSATNTGHLSDREHRMMVFIRFLGILMIAGGGGVYLLLTIVSQWDAGVGVGGLMVVVGIGMIAAATRALRLGRRQ